MRNHFLLGALLLLGAAPAAGAPPGAASAARGHDLQVELWAENDRDFFRPGESIRVRFRASESAYVAVLHLSTDGEVEFLYPRSPRDEGYVRGRRSYSLPHGSAYASWPVRGSSGIGYFYVIASEEPLDFDGFRDRYGGWDFRHVGRQVRGDPYYALDRITEVLLPDADHVNHAVDYFSYHVGRRHSYPRYACYDRYGYGSGGGWGEYYHSCDRLVVLLRNDPYYYDSRYHRGYRTRRVYLSDAGYSQPRHRYKEGAAAQRDAGPPLRTGSAAGDGYEGARVRQPGRARPEPAPRGEASPVDWDLQAQQGPPQQGRPRGSEPQRVRPTLQRRPQEQESPRQREESPRQREAPPAREPVREQPREPVREPPRSEPREERPREERSRPPEGASPRVTPPGGES